MRCPTSYRGRRRATPQRCRNPLSPFGLRRYGAVCGGVLPRRCFWLACVAPPGIRLCSAGNATVSTPITGFHSRLPGIAGSANLIEQRQRCFDASAMTQEPFDGVQLAR
jgi:hypothetical protein